MLTQCENGISLRFDELSVIDLPYRGDIFANICRAEILNTQPKLGKFIANRSHSVLDL